MFYWPEGKLAEKCSDPPQYEEFILRSLASCFEQILPTLTEKARIVWWKFGNAYLTGFLEASQRSTELVFYTCTPRPWTQAECLLPVPEDLSAPAVSLWERPAWMLSAGLWTVNKRDEILPSFSWSGKFMSWGHTKKTETLTKTYIKNNSIRKLQLRWIEFKCYTFATYKMPEFKLYLN